MLRLNLRKGESTWRFGNTPVWSELAGPELSPEQVAARLEGKRVLLLLHGYNTTDAFGAFAEIALEMGHLYDEVIGVSMPLSRLELAFWLARMRATKAGRLLAAAIADLGSTEFVSRLKIDAETHSLGGLVLLEALDHGLYVRHAILTAPAVDNESIQEQERYALAVQRAERILVAHSRHDPVLRAAYKLGMWDNALGLTGPQNPELCDKRIFSLDCSDVVRQHGDYKRCKLLFDKWKEIAT
jgi:esterase/lipase superfamily enzyme